MLLVICWAWALVGLGPLDGLGPLVGLGLHGIEHPLLGFHHDLWGHPPLRVR